MDISIKIIDKKHYDKHNDNDINDEKETIIIDNKTIGDKEMEENKIIEQKIKSNKNRKFLVKIFLGITIFFIISTLVCNCLILYIRHQLHTKQSIYSISNKLHVKICFLVSSVLLLVLIALMTFLYPFYNSYKC